MKLEENTELVFEINYKKKMNFPQHSNLWEIFCLLSLLTPQIILTINPLTIFIYQVRNTNVVYDSKE